MTPGALLTQWARLLLGSLRRAGVRDVLISPGSRSTPFVAAALREPGLRCRSIVDERSAAYFALGQARVTGRPSLLICTSGTAAANYAPAVVEADRAGLPLLVLTADRPLELQRAEAPQTIDQTRLYGTAARAFFELGTPEPGDASLRFVARVAAQAWHLARSPRPGPVHLNARARKPLDPVEPASAADRDLAARVDALLDAGPPRAPRPRLLPSDDDIAALARELREARRPVIALGPMAPWQAPDPADVHRLAARLGAVLYAEATSQARFGADPAADTTVADALPWLLGSARLRDGFHPDRVLELGPPPTATAWRELLANRPALRRHVVWHGGWSDPHATAAVVWTVPPATLVEALLRHLDGAPDHAPSDHDSPADPAWHRAVRTANARAWEVVDRRLAGTAAGVPRGAGPASTPDAGEPPTAEAAAVRAAVAALPAGSALVLGNSMPVRHVDAFCRARDAGVRVFSQRGASGIDGVVSGAAGVAAASGAPTLLLVGDVSLLHDLGGLAAARGVESPLAIVVLDNGGGRIFDSLPLARSGAVSDDDWAFWRTPPRLDVAAVAAALGLAHRPAGPGGELTEAVTAALTGPGATLVHVAVPGDGGAALQRAIVAELEA